MEPATMNRTPRRSGLPGVHLAPQLPKCPKAPEQTSLHRLLPGLLLQKPLDQLSLSLRRQQSPPPKKLKSRLHDLACVRR